MGDCCQLQYCRAVGLCLTGGVELLVGLYGDADGP